MRNTTLFLAIIFSFSSVSYAGLSIGLPGAIKKQVRRLDKKVLSALKRNGAPTSLSAQAGNAAAEITWTSVSGASSYNLYWGNTPQQATGTGNKASLVTSPYYLTGLANEVTYYFAISSVADDVESNLTPVAHMSPSFLLPLRPEGVAGVSGIGEVTLIWNSVPGAAFYNIYWGAASGVTSASTKISSASAPYAHTVSAYGQTYYYRVSALNAAGESLLSAETRGRSIGVNDLNWSDKNRRILNQLVTDYGFGGQHYSIEKPPYAVLDWDQTCAYLDVEEAMMRYQLFHLVYKLTKDEFRDLLKDSINGITQLSQGYQNVRLTDINRDLIADYDFLYDNFSGFNGAMTIEEIRETLQYKDFIAKIPFLYAGYCETPGIGADYGYPWVLYLFEGFTTDEVKVLAREVIAYELGNSISEQTLQSPANLPTNAGAVSYSYKTGLRVFPEMQKLISTFKTHGIDVFIVSASYKPVVEAFSGIGAYGYNISAEKIVAMELATGSDGKILPGYKAGWVKTFRQGKVDAVNMAIKTGLGKNWDPLFSAGDSDGDYEMLTGFPDMKLSLVWNRVKGGDIGKLCRLAVDEASGVTPRYILQGRNENTGAVIPSMESILFGKTEPQLMY